MTFLKIAWRNILKRPVHTLILMLGIGTGVFSLVLYLAMLEGFYKLMIDNVVDTGMGNIQIHRKDFLLKKDVKLVIDNPDRIDRIIGDTEHITGYSPRIRFEGMVSSPNSSSFVQVTGINQELEKNITVIYKYLTEGRLLEDSDDHGIFMGEALAEKLKVGLDDKIVIMARDAKGDTSGVAFRIKGLFRSSSKNFDKANVYITLDAAQKMLSLQGKVHEISIKVDKPEFEDLTRDELNLAMDDDQLIAQTWKELSPVTWHQIEASRQVSWIMFLFVFVSMAFGIINAFMMEIFERIREFGIMMSLGTKPVNIFCILIYEAVFLGILGAVAGVVCSWFTAVVLLKNNVDVSAFAEGMDYFGYGSSFPLIITTESLVICSVSAIIMVVVASLYPAIRASMFKPVEAIHHV